MSSSKQEKGHAAFDRIHKIGGHGVWESDMVVITLSGTEVTDDDLALFRDFEFVQILDLSNTRITDDGLIHLMGLNRLTSLSLVNTGITPAGVAKLRTALPNTEIRTEPAPKGKINRFTGKPFGQ